ncbi:2,3-bisphosphoglycerate-dependent phosphoglycerate mutase [Halotia branconii]|uniref:2,3-bisphosphoglycerate-dependent phosphoglycerate mutase n=1 Tax=Halotia branconii CENA392 TaxID=1539056 RepID=A0AAJ6NNE8_9CYAN|nr:2,3-bisphosphoglycerate-dependent phosphoglycerate mutase [Halotia branconii]WGV23448.1 2,3-bisphosphoglycerate-dependent phosphoglycerate mutase [Halotia branconii CENA392]
MTKLFLVRHGQSTWNAANRFSGWVDVPLNKKGRQEAFQAAHKLSSYQIDVGFTSLLVRAIETIAICLTECEQVCGGRSPVFKHDADDPNWKGWDNYEGDHSQEIPIFTSRDLDERYYGNLQGLNKTETVQKFGKDIVHQWRRSFVTRPPGGESLADTAARTIPFFGDRIMKHLRDGDNVLVSAHGNSLRSIIMYLDHLDEQEVANLELVTGIPIVYDINAEEKVTSKIILN